MSMLQTGARSAVAFQLAAELEEYERDVECLARGRCDLEHYQQVSQRMDRMRMYAASLPQVSVAWVEVLIGHFELTHGLWRVQSRQPQDLAALGERQLRSVRRLRDSCVARYLSLH